MAAKKAYTEKDRMRFAVFMRNTRTEDVNRRIAAAFDIAAVEIILTKLPQEALDDELKKQNLEGYTINGRRITFSQAEIVYKMVRQGKYCEFPRPQPIAIFVPVPFETKFPDSISFLASGRETDEEYLKSYEARLQED